MTFKDYIEETRKDIKSHLAVFMDGRKSEDLPAIFKEQKLIDTLQDFALRGKLIRGTLFLFMTEALGVTIEKKHYDIACAIELMHSALLVQDDIIDRDRMRRGAQTVFSYYEEDGKKIGAFDPYHYGISTAIVVADVAFFFAIELIAEYNDPQLHALLKYYAHEVYLVAIAESVDSIFGQTTREPDDEDIYAVYKFKTARYTFSLPFEMAAIVAGTDKDMKDRLNRLGENAGIIFQLKDDEIGLFGQEDVIGKPVGSDIRENKKTIIRSMLYRYADEDDRRVLDECFGNAESGSDVVERIKSIYQKYDIKGKIDRNISDIMEKVWKDYADLTIKPESKEILKGLLEFNLQRSY